MPSKRLKMTPPKDVEVTTIAQAGDLILHVAPEKKDSAKLLVSSSVLKTSSEVFAALLGPNFREGQMKYDTASPATIMLPDDEPAAMALMCKMLHAKATERYFRPDHLLAFAVVVDKYGCRDAVRLQAQGLLLGYLEVTKGLRSVDGFSMVAVAAYLLNVPVAFSKATSCLIGKTPYDPWILSTGNRPSGPGQYVPAQLFGMLMSKRYQVRRVIDHWLPPLLGSCAYYACDECGEVDFAPVYKTLCNVFDIKFWPNSKITADVAFKKLPEVIGKPTTKSCEMAPGELVDRDSVEGLLNELADNTCGFCLYCIREDQKCISTKECKDAAHYLL